MNKKFIYCLFVLLFCISSCAKVTLKEDTVFNGIMDEPSTRYTIGPGDVIEATYYFQTEILKDDYALGLGDVFKVEFYYHPDYNRQLTVMPDGKVSLVGKNEMMVMGMKLSEVKEKIVELYSDIFREPIVTVTLVKYFQGVNQLKEAITTDSRGQSKILTVSPDGFISFPLIPKQIRVVDLSIEELTNMVLVEYEEILAHVSVSLFLAASNSHVAYIAGEVAKPNSYTISGPTTISQLLARAGVKTETADLDTVLLIRKNKDKNPEARLVDINKVFEDGDLSQDIYLKRYDIVYVPKTRISRANQFVAQYLSAMVPDFIRTGFNYTLSKRVE